AQQLSAALIEENDQLFKVHLDRYKYADRYPEQPMEHYRAQGAVFLEKLNELLQEHTHLAADHLSLADIALAPFVRQFAHVDQNWFAETPYRHLQAWLQRFLASELFVGVMAKAAAPQNP
ncbi:MAG: glutathione binding-like protein, partial [Pseudomonas sp.]|nr:glutathione binding-like protein [Pseudomonas sp.]